MVKRKRFQIKKDHYLQKVDGPLGSSYGGDNGSALFLTVSNEVFPAANAVNDGTRMGLKLIMRAGLDSSFKEETVVRVASLLPQCGEL